MMMPDIPLWEKAEDSCFPGLGKSHSYLSCYSSGGVKNGRTCTSDEVMSLDAATYHGPGALLNENQAFLSNHRDLSGQERIWIFICHRGRTNNKVASPGLETRPL